jgi:squalene-hopene/tetraprenyl-beta-curcumene cyclase
VQRRISGAIRRGLEYLASVQRSDGAFIPLWFGNQHAPQEESPVFGTGRVIAGLAPLGPGAAAAAPILDRAVSWLLAAQNSDGGWGAGPSVPATIEESSVAISGLAGAVRSGQGAAGTRESLARGSAWLTAATDGGRAFPASPLGLYFARLWYSERLYPLIFAAGALEALGAETFRT